MKPGTDILNELQTISPVLAGMDKVNVFTVPHGYFEGLADMLLLVSKDEENHILLEGDKENNDAVPVGYFDNLAADILSKIKEQQNNSTEELSKTLKAIQLKNVYQVPDGYFNNLSDTILNKVNTLTAQEEIRMLSPMLYSIQNENVFEVPVGYFSSFADDVLNKIDPKEAKVIVMQKRTTWFKYAVAAAFVGVMSFSAFKFINIKTDENKLTTAQVEGLKIARENRFEEEFAKVSDDEIASFLTNEGVDVEAAVAFTQIQEKEEVNEPINKSESEEIDELFNQLDETKTMN